MVTYTVLAVAVSSYAMLQSLVVPVLTRIQTEYSTDQTTVTWVLTAYLLSASICTPLIGRIGDAFGKTQTLVAAMTVLVLGSLAAGLAPSIGWLIAARVLQGAGGGVLPLAYGIVRDEFDERVGATLASLASLLAVGYGTGLVVAGPIVHGLGYRWLFWLPSSHHRRCHGGRRSCCCRPHGPARATGSRWCRPPCCRRAWWHCCWGSAGRHMRSSSVPVLLLFVTTLLAGMASVGAERRAPYDDTISR